MARPEIATLLAKDFVDVKIDNDRMTGGKEVYAAQLAAFGREAGGIPWFAFLDEAGKGLVDSCDAKGGTIGFPYQVDEVAVFEAMLKAARQHLTDDDIATLVKSLHENRLQEEAKKKAAAAPAPAPAPKTGNGIQ